MHKKLIAILLAAIMLASLSACGEQASTNENETTTAAQSENITDTTNKEKETTEAKEEMLNTDDETDKNSSESVDSIRPNFKEAMDSYEAFYDEYCNFMKKYKKNPTDLNLLTEYTDMMKMLTDMDSKFAAWENEDLNTAEAAYYLEVQTRISKKLLEVAQ